MDRGHGTSENGIPGVLLGPAGPASACLSLLGSGGIAVDADSPLPRKPCHTTGIGPYHSPAQAEICVSMYSGPE